MKFYLCIDDTDTLDSVGTGTLAENIRRIITDKALAKCGFITRHQLFLHEDIAYTSHNSSMCFDGSCDDEGALLAITECAKTYLDDNAAQGSDPGLCVARAKDLDYYKSLITFGWKAKRIVLTKAEAYIVASKLGVHLTEHGGTGIGVIGALAGVGLRMSGNDGEIKGGVKRFFNVDHIDVASLKAHPSVDDVRDIGKHSLEDHHEIYFTKHSKTILDHHRFILLVDEVEKGRYLTCTKEQLRGYRHTCLAFMADVEEELVSEVEQSCHNCRYRRWTNRSFECMKGFMPQS